MTGFSLTGGGTITNNPGGSSGAIQWNDSGAFGGLTVSGDGVLVAATGVLTISAIGGNAVVLGGAFTMSGAHTFTGTITANTSVTFPTSGTLVNSAVTTLSSLTSVGTIGTGVWQGTVVGATYGGTGVNNGASTITIGGSVTMAGAFTFAGTVTANTAVTFPTSGLLATTTPAYVGKTGTYGIGAADYMIDCTSGTFTATLPTAVGVTGKNYVIKNSGAGVITVATTSAQTIDGAATVVLAAQYQSITVISDGANWKIIGVNP